MTFSFIFILRESFENRKNMPITICSLSVKLFVWLSKISKYLVHYHTKHKKSSKYIPLSNRKCRIILILLLIIELCKYLIMWLQLHSQGRNCIKECVSSFLISRGMLFVSWDSIISWESACRATTYPALWEFICQLDYCE